jgi:hypothetical protein
VLWYIANRESDSLAIVMLFGGGCPYVSEELVWHYFPPCIDVIFLP